MDSLASRYQPSGPWPAWEAEVARIADERHLAAWSDDRGERLRFGARLGSFVQGLHDTEIVRLFGGTIIDLESLCRQIEAALPGEGDAELRRRIPGPSGLVARLRSAPTFAGRPALRRRFILWHDVDVLLEHDAELFGEVIDAIAGVAAESEFASEDALLVTRAIYVGGPRLAAYAGDESGQLRAWRSSPSAEPFWRAVAGIDRPPVLAAPIAKLLADPGGLADEMLLSDLELDDALGY